VISILFTNDWFQNCFKISSESNVQIIVQLLTIHLKLKFKNLEFCQIVMTLFLVPNLEMGQIVGFTFAEFAVTE